MLADLSVPAQLASFGAWTAVAVLIGKRWYGDYPGGAVTDPTGPARGYYRMARGGSWRTDARLGRSAARAGGSEGRLDYTIGFRIALSRPFEK